MNKIRKLVIPVAGLGTRFFPVTKSVPKEMLPIIDKPVIMILLEEAQKAGIEEVLFIISNRKKIIKDFFEKDIDIDKNIFDNDKIEQLNKIYNLTNSLNISYVIQDKPLGSGNAILCAKYFINNEPFAIILGDDIIKDNNALSELILKYNQTKNNIIGINEVSSNELSKYGIISFSDIKNYKIEEIVEKPDINSAPSNFAGLGRYILNPEIFKYIEELETKNIYQLTDAINMLANEQDIYGCVFSGKYFDIGSKLGYIKANIEFGLDNEEISKELKDYIEKIRINF